MIDEAVGIWIALFALTTQRFDLSEVFILYCLGFALFRLFDIWKPWPVSWADQLPGKPIVLGFGIMMDDILAGIYAFILVNILIISWGI